MGASARALPGGGLRRASTFRVRCASWSRGSASQAAIVRRSIDRLWEDQSIESCEDWVVDYIGDLLATNLMAGLDDARPAHGRRARRSTTGAARAPSASSKSWPSDLTGWSVRVVEQFRRLGRTRHGLDPAIGLPASSERSARAAAARLRARRRAHAHRRPEASPTCATSTGRASRTRRSTSTSTPPTSGAAEARPAGYTIPRLGGLRVASCAASESRVRRGAGRGLPEPVHVRPDRPRHPAVRSRAAARSATRGSRRASTRYRGRSRPTC